MTKEKAARQPRKATQSFTAGLAALYLSSGSADRDRGRHYETAKDNADKLARKLGTDLDAHKLLMDLQLAYLDVIETYRKELIKRTAGQESKPPRRGLTLQKHNLEQYREGIEVQRSVIKAFLKWVKEHPGKKNPSVNWIAKKLASELGLGVSTVRKYLPPVKELRQVKYLGPVVRS